jgi:cytochrome c
MRTFAVLLLLLALPETAGAQQGGVDKRSCAQATRPLAQALAERAAAHLEKVGHEQAFRDFQDAAGGFRDGDLYVFVFDFEGTLVASGGFPEHVGRNLINHHAPAPQQVGAILRTAKTEGRGWVDYLWLNPCSGRRELKISYVIRVGPHVVGVGAYLREGV